MKKGWVIFVVALVIFVVLFLWWAALWQGHISIPVF